MNKYIYALTLGLLLMNEKIPSFLIRYIRTHKPDTYFVSVWVALASMAGAPNIYDSILRQVILKELEWKGKKV